MQKVQNMPVPGQDTTGLLSRIFGLSSSCREMAVVFMLVGVFFLAVGFHLVLGLNVQQGAFYAALAPGMAGATLLVCQGIHLALQSEGFDLNRFKLILPGALFGATVLMGLLPGMAAELMLISLWLGLSGMGITVFLAMATGLCARDTAQQGPGNNFYAVTKRT